MLHYQILQVLIILAFGNFLTPYLSKNLTNTNLRVIKAITYGYASLIIPVVLAALLFDSPLRLVFFLHSIFGILLLLFYTLQALQNMHKYYWKISTLINQMGLLDLLLVLLFIGYGFLLIMYDLRGYDALQFYIPNAFYFFLEDDIPVGLNPFTFFPTFKPPANVIILMQGLYLARDFTANLHILLLILGTSLLIYEGCREIGLNDYLGKLGVIAFLILPFTFFLMFEYAYYQEPQIMFFYSVAIFGVNKLDKDGMPALVAISSSLAILSKMSGYSVFLLIFLVMKLPSNYQRAQIVVFVLMGLQLLRKGSVRYILNFIPILLFLFIYLYLVLREPDVEKKIAEQILRILRWPFLVGFIWLIFMLQIQEIDTFLIDTYLKSGTSISFTFNSLTPFATFIENGMGVNFISSFLYIAIGTLFNPILFPFLIVGLISNTTQHYSKWFILFYVIWFSYFGTTSGRYLAPLIVPYIVICMQGLSIAVQKLGFNSKNPFPLFIIGTNVIFVLPALPLRILLLQQNIRFYSYYEALIVVLSFMILILMLYYKISRVPIIQSRKFRSIFFICSIGLAPFALIFSGTVITGFDRDEFNEEYNYISRPHYQELIDYLVQIDIDLDARFVTLETPGLGYFILRSVLDLGILSTSANVSSRLLSSNQTTVIEFLDENNFEYIVSLNSSHVFYTEFVRRYESLQVFQIAGNSDFFDVIFGNSEYFLHRRNIG